MTNPSNYAYIRAVQTNSTNGACVARFTSTQSIPMAYQCINPTTCSSSQTFTVKGTAIPGYQKTGPVTTYANVPLTFDINGNAAIPINYSDVGQVHLLASLALPATANDPAYTMTGQSNDFVVKPFKTGELAQRIKDLTYEISEVELKELLHGLHVQDLRLHEIPSLKKITAGCDLYPLSHEAKSMCVALPKGQMPQHVARLAMKDLTKLVSIYRKCAFGWRKVWPRSSNMSKSSGNIPA
ncbi:MAG: hypothetical protein EOO38_29135 [Cytophagaceae bacterium]|nr:MAG: hypothetical protein EOO38_29135 [Cytophagaceae bacterium]